MEQLHKCEEWRVEFYFTGVNPAIPTTYYSTTRSSTVGAEAAELTSLAENKRDKNENKTRQEKKGWSLWPAYKALSFQPSTLTSAKNNPGRSLKVKKLKPKPKPLPARPSWTLSGSDSSP